MDKAKGFSIGSLNETDWGILRYIFLHDRHTCTELAKLVKRDKSRCSVSITKKLLPWGLVSNVSQNTQEKPYELTPKGRRAAALAFQLDRWDRTNDVGEALEKLRLVSGRNPTLAELLKTLDWDPDSTRQLLASLRGTGWSEPDEFELKAARRKARRLLELASWIKQWGDDSSIIKKRCSAEEIASADELLKTLKSDELRKYLPSMQYTDDSISRTKTFFVRIKWNTKVLSIVGSEEEILPSELLKRHTQPFFIYDENLKWHDLKSLKVSPDHELGTLRKPSNRSVVHVAGAGSSTI